MLSGCQCLRDQGRLSIRHRGVPTEALGLKLRGTASDSSFRCFFHQVDVAVLCAANRDWTTTQIADDAADLDQLVCNSKTLRGSIKPTAGGSSAFIDQVRGSLATLGATISQARCAVGDKYEREVLRQLLCKLDPEGVLIQADALHRRKPFSIRPGTGSLLPSESESQSKDAKSSDSISVPAKTSHPLCGK